MGGLKSLEYLIFDFNVQLEGGNEMGGLKSGWIFKIRFLRFLFEV